MSLDFEAVWSDSVNSLKTRLDPQIFSAWIKPLTISGLIKSNGSAEENGLEASTLAEIELIAPNKFCCDHIRKHYGEIISETITGALSSVNGINKVTLRFRPGGLSTKVTPQTTNGSVNNGLNRAESSLSSILSRKMEISRSALHQKSTAPPRSFSNLQARTPKDRTQGFESNLNSKYTFANYIVGDCNRLAHSAALQVLQNPGKQYNPLFIYGGVGLGKTHLVNALGNALLAQGKNVALVSSEIFVNELISSIRNNKMAEFKKKFRSLDLLIVDDIQFLIGKERTEEEFFHTFNDLYNRNKQIIVTSDRLPMQLAGLDERLKTRFSSGLFADLKAPDFDTRVEIIKTKAESFGLELSKQVAGILSDKIDSNVRELEGALNRLRALSSLYDQPINEALALEAVKSFVLEKKTPDLGIESIQQTVAEFYHLDRADLLGKRRTKLIAEARHVAMFLCRKLTRSSYPEIGTMFGGRDHSTAIHAYGLIERRIGTDKQIKENVSFLERSLLN
jgi:chromosomal replication initiator protein